YMREPERAFEPALTPLVSATLAFTAVGTIGIGLFPAWFLRLAQQSAFGG
ncbi:NADH-quinone oxidoreductase subunit N, partial [Sinorhizobium meliloti]